MKSILLVDDEMIICAALQKMLRRSGFNVDATHSFEAALRKIRKGHFDAVLVEFNLKSERKAHPTTENGLQLIRRLRAAEVEAPILMFTAMEGELYEAASLDAGADDFIPKTVGVPCLVARLRAHLRRHERELVKGSVPWPRAQSLRTL
jgi:DNA-binding response OmpR family regulator